MAIYRFSLTYRTRTPGSGPATKVVQYLVREGEYAPTKQELDYLTRASDATQDRGDLRHVEFGNLPPWAHEDPAIFFQAAFEYERVNGRYATAIQMSLPRELSHEQHLALTRDFVQTHLHDKPSLWVKHEPVAHDGQPQPHVHILMSERTVDGIDREAHQTFRRFNREHPERGGCEKDRFWSERRALDRLRVSWASLSNYHLEVAGVTERIDPRTLRDQAIDRAPEKKWGTERQARDQGQEQAKAAAAWELHKTHMGITNVHDVPREMFIDRVREHARAGRPGKAIPPPNLEQLQAYGQHLQVQARTLEEQAQQYETHATRLGAERHLAALQEARGKAGHPVAVERVERLLQQGVALGLDRDNAQPLTRPLIGNKLSMIYHTPEHKNYGDVHPKNQVHFWTVQAALDAGYREAANQHYGRGTGIPMTVEERQTRGEALGHGTPREQDREHRAAVEERVAAIQARQVSRLAATVELLDDDAPQGGVKVRLRGRERETSRGMDIGF
jgi:hypothetical protein